MKDRCIEGRGDVESCPMTGEEGMCVTNQDEIFSLYLFMLMSLSAFALTAVLLIIEDIVDFWQWRRRY